MNRTEQEYREALDGLRFSEDAKRRMMDNLMEQKEEKPMKERNIRPLRMGLIAAALCAAMVLTAGAANVIARQSRITYLEWDQFKKEYNEYLDEHGESPNNYSNASYTGRDFKGTDEEAQEDWWEGPSGELVEDTAGTAANSWTGKRVFKRWESSRSHMPLYGKTCYETRYRADLVSDFDSSWDCWDMSWVEGHYKTTWAWSRTLASEAELDFMAMGGEYRSGETRFNMSYCWDGCFVQEDEFRVAGRKEYFELYTTPDGAEVAIEMDTSETGKRVFWANLWGGHSSFSMFGTQMELDDLHDLLDNMNLSKLLEYNPVN